MIGFKCFKPVKEAIKSLENRPSVYIVFLGTEPIYVGSTSAMRRRAYQHFIATTSILAEKLSRALGREGAKKLLANATLCIHYTDTLNEARTLELELIKRLKPVMNTKYVKLGKNA